VTFSILLTDPTSGEIGGGVASRFLAAGALVLHAQAGYGAIATQALVDVSFGPRGLRPLELGVPAVDVVRLLTGQDESPADLSWVSWASPAPGPPIPATSARIGLAT